MPHLALVVCVCAVFAGCGTEKSASEGGAPSSGEIAACLHDSGFARVKRVVNGDYEEILALTPTGDVVFVLNLSAKDEAEKATDVVRRAMKEGRPGAIPIFATVNEGFTVVGVVGVPGRDGGVPSISDERLARDCATHAREIVRSYPQDEVRHTYVHYRVPHDEQRKYAPPS